MVTKAGVTALMVAAGMGYHKPIRGGEQPIEALKICLDKGVDINAATDKTLNTALHAAAGQGTDDIVQFLADHGAKLDAQGQQGPYAHGCRARLKSGRRGRGGSPDHRGSASQADGTGALQRLLRSLPPLTLMQLTLPPRASRLNGPSRLPHQRMR